MRICLVVHGFPPLERTGVENYTQALALALSREGHVVEVFAPRARPDLPELSVRREVRPGYAVTWLTTNAAPRDPAEALEPPGVAARFAAFLDRERPDVVHFQHVVKLGVGLIDQARERDIPTVYTAHDYFAVCHRYTLLRPNLTRCDTIGDAMTCARCDLALAALNRRADELGDYQMGVLETQSDDAERAGLAALVDEGEPGDLGLSYEDLDREFDRRQVLDGRRAEAFCALDRVLAPTEYLATQLRAGGVPPESISVLPYGIDRTFAEEVAPRPRRGDGPLAIGFLSGMAKHKGAHVLLDAFAAMETKAELHLFGGSTDAPYLDAMRARAREVGATWHGPFGRDDLAACLSRVDVVVVPSIWVENQPIVIREAFAAGRPVVAPNLGAFPESVRDGVDGLLYEADSATDLARSLDRLVREDGLVDRLAEGIAPVHDVAAQAGELVPIYTELLGAREKSDAPDKVLPSLEALAANHDRLDAEPTRVLFERALRGLSALRAGLGDGSSPEDLMLRALRTGSKAQEDLRDRVQQTDWMQETIEAEEAEVAWMREQIAAKEGELGAAATERDWLREVLSGKDQELASLREERDWLRKLQVAHEEEVAALRQDVEQLASVGEQLSSHLRHTAEFGMKALEAQTHALGEEAAPLLETLRRNVDEEALATKEEGGEGNELDALIRALRTGSVRLQLIERELGWRRDQMRAAADAVGRKPISYLLERTGLGRIAMQWSEGESPDQGDGEAGA